MTSNNKQHIYSNVTISNTYILNKGECAMEDTNIKSEVGKRLLELRKEKGLKQDEVAQAVGITRASLSYYEKGERSVDIEVLYKLSSYYNISIDYLFGLSDKAPPKRDFSTNEELSSIGLSPESMDRIWSDSRFADLLNEFIAHKDFDKFCELTYSRYTSYEYFSKAHKSFLLSQLLYSMVGDIMEKWYMKCNDEIAALPLEAKKKLYEEIQEFLSMQKQRDELLDSNHDITSENIEQLKYIPDMDENMNEIYRKIKYLLKK